VLELRGVTYRYPGSGSPALVGIDLDVRAGQVVGVVGANDAGKSTLCLVAAGLAGSSGGALQGEVLVGGASIVGRPTHELAGVVGIVFQDPATQRSGVTGTVFEEVAFGPVNLGWPIERTVDSTRRTLADLGIEHLAERHPARLSGGQAQLVAIASILAMGPRAVVLDEPAAQLDPEATGFLITALRAAAGAGTSLLIAEQRTEVLAELATRIVVLDGGRLAREGPSDQVLGDRRLADLGVPVPHGRAT
jgi:energy-coupling factor transport system ATP-binding protein